jgi:hypothetical protein
MLKTIGVGRLQKIDMSEISSFFHKNLPNFQQKKWARVSRQIIQSIWNNTASLATFVHI